MIESDEEDFLLLEEALGRIPELAFELDWISDPSEARSALEGSGHDACFLAHPLAGRSTVDWLEECRHGSPVVLLGDEDVELEATRAGTMDFLMKDEMDAAVLERCIRHILRHTRSLRALTESNERFELAVRGARDGLWDWNLEKDEVYYSPRWNAMLGHPEEATSDTAEYWFQSVHPGDLDRLRQEIRNHLDGKTPALDCEYRARRADGTELWCLARGVAVRDDAGIPYRLAGSQTDVTERRSSVERALSHVSHELRTPLSAISQFVSILLDGVAGQLSDQQREYLFIAKRNTEQLAAMIEDLMEATRATSGELSLTPCLFSISDLVYESMRSHSVRAKQKNVTLRSVPGADVPGAFADPKRTRQVLHNLIENAIKFTEEGGTVTVSAEAGPPGELRVRVEDTGRGIDPESVPRVFERLFQVEGASDESRKGLGLGLYIAKELVTRQGGRIWVESVPGRGSRFFFTVPTRDR